MYTLVFFSFSVFLTIGLVGRNVVYLCVLRHGDVIGIYTNVRSMGDSLRSCVISFDSLLDSIRSTLYVLLINLSVDILFESELTLN